MSGGHWDYEHSRAADQFDSLNVDFIQMIMNEVNSDLLGLTDYHQFQGINHGQRSLLNRNLLEMDEAQTEAKELINRLRVLFGTDSRLYRMADAFDRFYSGDIGLETLLYRLNEQKPDVTP